MSIRREVLYKEEYEVLREADAQTTKEVQEITGWSKRESRDTARAIRNPEFHDWQCDCCHGVDISTSKHSMPSGWQRFFSRYHAEFVIVCSEDCANEMYSEAHYFSE